jgi:hypothetical protein
MAVVGPVIIFALIVIVLGQPVLWLYLILHNKAIIWSIPVFGDSSSEKWETIASKMSSPGVFLFYQYRRQIVIWGMVIPMTKLVYVILTQVAEYAWGGTAYFLMLAYGLVAFLNWRVHPYIYPFNNWLDMLMGVSNALMAIVPICTFHKVTLPAVFVYILTIALMVLPVLALIYSFVRTSKQVDPTMGVDEDGNQVDAIIDDEERTIDIELVQLLSIWQREVAESGEMRDENELSDGEAQMNGEKLTVNVGSIKEKFEKMYEQIDKICDAVTSDELIWGLKLAVSLGACCAGWFFGGVSGRGWTLAGLDC